MWVIISATQGITHKKIRVYRAGHLKMSHPSVDQIKIIDDHMISSASKNARSRSIIGIKRKMKKWESFTNLKEKDLFELL